MTRTLRRTAALLTALTLLLTGCGGGEEPLSVPVETTTTTATTTTTTTKPPLGLNALTGVEDMKTDNDRPIGFVVTDEDQYHVQIGLDKADMYFESETEAGIPRILAIFSSIDRIPDEIGPVRSARPHFVKFAAGMDAMYGHIGGSRTGLDTIRALGVAEIGSAEHINSVLAASKNRSWNRKTFVASKVRSEAANRGHRLTTDADAPFVFGNKTGSAVANTVVVRISHSYHMAFTYDSAKGVYQKHRNSLDTPIHTVHGGGTIEVSNVIVLYDTRQVDPKDANRCDYPLVSGSGTVASGGTSRGMRWARDDSGLHFYESDGTTPLAVATGKTYVCLVNEALKSGTKIS